MDQNIQEIIIESIQVLFNFSTDCETNYIENKPIPRLSELTQTNIIGVDLSLGFNKNKLIENYSEYYFNLWSYFIRILNEKDIIKNEKPDFVSFSNIIADCLTAKYDCWSKKLFAIKLNGVIYLYNDTMLGESIESMSSTEKYKGFRRKLYHTIRLRFLMAGLDSNKSNDFERCLTVGKFKLNNKIFITLNTVSAINENNEFVLIKTQPNTAKIFRELYFWSYCTINGIKRIINGYLEKNSSNLRQLDNVAVDEMLDKNRRFYSESECYKFMDQLFDVIKENVTQEMIVYELDLIKYRENNDKTFRQTNSARIEDILPKKYR